MDVLAVIPSIGGPDFGSVIDLQYKLQSIERISCVVVSNSHKLTKILNEQSVPFITDERNGGFGRSIGIGASTRDDWRWLLIVNDDISITAEFFSDAIEQYLSQNAEPLEIVYFDEDKPRSVPARLDVFLQVSLLGKIFSKLRKSPDKAGLSYRSFSCVAISRDLYDLCQGFDEELLFTYEDADFVTRASQLGAVQRVAHASGVRHYHSVSSGKHVDTVLPVATYSAARYLDKIGGGTLSTSAIVLMALIVRLLFVPATRAAKWKHVRGIGRSAVSVLRRSSVRPDLPAYDTL